MLGGQARPVALGLLGPSNSTYPSPNFVTTPESPVAPATVVADASATRDEGQTCFSCSYSWTTSDGQSASGRYASFFFMTAGTYSINLVVTDATGTSNSIMKVVEVETASEDDEEEEEM